MAQPDPHVFFTEVWQRLLFEFRSPLRVCTGDIMTCQTGLPNAQKPYLIEAHFGQIIEFGIRNVVRGRLLAESSGQLGQPDARLNLIERGMSR